VSICEINSSSKSSIDICWDQTHNLPIASPMPSQLIYWRPFNFFFQNFSRPIENSFPISRREFSWNQITDENFTK
jgi:hypothetical protein